MPAATNIEAVVFDLDGTAIPSRADGMPPQSLIDAIAQAQPKFRLCTATGRAWGVAEQVLATLRLTDPCIISGGTMIVNPVSHEILWQACIPPQSARAIASFMRAHSYPTAYARGLDVYDDLDRFDTGEAVKIMYVLDVPTAELEGAISKLKSIPGITVSKASSWTLEDGMDLHITSSIATKEHAIHELATIIGVPASRMAGVGDGHNDIHLFNSVGHKVAMGNAVPELKSAADEVIGPLDEDGLAQYILSLC